MRDAQDFSLVGSCSDFAPPRCINNDDIYYSCFCHVLLSSVWCKLILLALVSSLEVTSLTSHDLIMHL